MRGKFNHALPDSSMGLFDMMAGWPKKMRWTCADCGAKGVMCIKVQAKGGKPEYVCGKCHLQRLKKGRSRR